MSGFVFGHCDKPPQGPRGPTGATGPAGLTGATGATGSTGYFSEVYAFAYSQSLFSGQPLVPTSYSAISPTINPVEFNYNGVITDGIEHGMSGPPSEFVLLEEGWYIVNWVFTLENISNTSDVNVQVILFKNGTALLPDPFQEFYLLFDVMDTGEPYLESFAGYSLIPFSQNDVLELVIVAQSEDDSFNVEVLTPRISIVKINAPL